MRHFRAKLRIMTLLPIARKYWFKAGKPGLLGSGFDSEGQLKERSEGDQAQWQTALGEVLAAGS